MRSVTLGHFPLVLSLSLWVSSLSVRSAEADFKQPEVRELGDGRIEVGGVIVDREKRSVTFDAMGCIDNGLVEYFLVHESGKTHESVLKTTVEPYYLNVAMLLLGAKGADAKGAKEPPQNITDEYLKGSSKPEGSPVRIVLSWKNDGRRHEVQAGQTVRNTETKTGIASSAWVYNGSILTDGDFLAQTSGSMASIVTDPEAMFNYVGEGRDRDDIWSVDPEKTPKADQKIEVTIQLQKSTAEPPTPH